MATADQSFSFKVGDTTKTYTLLSSLSTGNKLGQTPITKCSALIENKMQCWRAGDFMVMETTDVPATEKDSASVKYLQYQLCRAHAVQQQQKDEKTQRDAEAAKAAEATAAADASTDTKTE